MTTDTIYIHGLTLKTIIGCLPHEKQAPQMLIFDIDIEKNLQPAAEQDDVHLTIDYASVVAEVKNFVLQTKVELIETLAEKLAHFLLKKFPIEKIILKIQKPEAIANVPKVGVIITRVAT